MLKLPAIIVSVSLTAFARPTGDVAQFTYDAASPTSQSVHRFVGRGGGVSIVINNADPRKFTYSLFTRLATDSDDKLAEVAHTLNASLVLPKEPDPADMGDFQEGYPSDKDIVANIKEGARKYFSNEGEAAKTALKDMPKGLTTERNSVALDKDGKPAFTADKQKNLEKAYDKVAAYVSSVNDAVNTALQYYTPRVLSLSATGFQVDTMVVLKQIRVDDAKSATVVGKYTIDVARPPKIVGTLNTSLYFTSGTRDILSYRALDAYDSGGARIKLNGQDAFRIVGDRLSTSIEPNIGGVVYFVFDFLDIEPVSCSASILRPTRLRLQATRLDSASFWTAICPRRSASA